MNIIPLGNRILIKRLAAQTSKGGILLPDSAQEKPKQGEVISVGPGKYDENGKLMEMELKKGDRVLFTSYAGTEVLPDEEEDLLILSEEDVLAVLN